MSNHLKNATSPYLLQHAENPVDWYPWCKQAFEKAKSEDKPIFLSIGYSTCHWCHVMAHESFEDKKTAEILNQYFVSIKIDREERPDIDSVYMSVCQAFTGSGGWPMSIFMTWDKKPFFAGTYFPPKSHYGMPGFPDLLDVIVSQWNNNRRKLLQSAEQIITHLKSAESGDKNIDDEELIKRAMQIFSESFDEINGGFSSAPKFPTPHNLLFLMLYAKHKQDSDALKMAEKTLLQMRKGGIFDHIGYGFSRYSTDKYFLAPHFEKMLYDNALLIIAYSAAYYLTNNEIYLDTAEKTTEYILREMTSADGGFYSAQDADSEGVEGKYYTFTLDEIINVLGEEKGKRFAESFDITSNGNFEGVNILNLLKSNDLESDFSEEIHKLYDYRKKRTNLHLDDKILLSWNSLMIAALSMFYRVSRNEKYLNAVVNAQKFIEENMCDGVQLFTSWRDGKHSEKSFLDDYAFYIASLIELYNSTLDKIYLEKAERFCDEAVRQFEDCQRDGFYLCEASYTEIFMNPKETYDGAIPSGNSVMAYNFVRMFQLTENEKYRKLTEKQFEFLSVQAQDYPAGNSVFLLSKLLYENPPEHIVIAVKHKSDFQEIQKELPFLANVSVVLDSVDYPLKNDKVTYYVCKNHTCSPPTNIL
ncbi:thioredoxin domain-containing protein [Porcipelethomonas ammoniilytica]|uniref:thioredoxin domain-containing protein n=1 Tax=Porcipelethomonas ammoniilytica TaxID=2981722 RepID=UPI000822E0B8|nr:thioredoxin domain-containing protein [Porcipelethomonas ammoniilytica]MCU6720097.1 thioredoxin domain-containing protein [Porcipelethomonas ammoniilytica]SCJ01576.1 Thioredoxin-related protein [uncultured Ruminococcus sp.]